MRKATWGWLAAGVAAAAAIAAVVYEERKASKPASPGLVFKPSARGSGWSLQQQFPGGGAAHLIPIKMQPTPPQPSVTFSLPASTPMSTPALKGVVVGVTVPARFDLMQVAALSTPAPIDASPVIPAGIDMGRGGTVLVTLSGAAGDVIFSGVAPDGTAFSALLHLTGFGKP